MSPVTLRFLFTSMAYLGLGVIIGVLFLAFPGTRVLGTVHAHLNLVGFVIFTIFAVAYHILPRFRGRPLFSERMAEVQFWTAQVGLIGLLIFMAVQAYQPFVGIEFVLAVFGATLALSVFLFIYNIWLTLS